MNEINDKENIASDEEVDNVDAEPLNTDSDHNDLDLTTLDLDDPNSDPNEKIIDQNVPISSATFLASWCFTHVLYIGVLRVNVNLIEFI